MSAAQVSPAHGDDLPDSEPGGAWEIERKWVLLGEPRADGPHAHGTSARLWQRYLVASPGLSSERVRVVRPLEGGEVEHWHTRKQAGTCASGEAEVRHEIEERVSAEVAETLLARADPSRLAVEKIRTTFTHGEQELTLDQLLRPVECWLLEAELSDPADQVVLPDLGVVALEVTGVSGWSNRALARGVEPVVPLSVLLDHHRGD